jgi:hypothetical protein
MNRFETEQLAAEVAAAEQRGREQQRAADVAALERYFLMTYEWGVRDAATFIEAQPLAATEGTNS